MHSMAHVKKFGLTRRQRIEDVFGFFGILWAVESINSVAFQFGGFSFSRVPILGLSRSQIFGINRIRSHGVLVPCHRIHSFR